MIPIIVITKNSSSVNAVSVSNSGIGPVNVSNENQINTHLTPALSSDGAHTGQGAVTITMKGGSTVIAGFGAFIVPP